MSRQVKALKSIPPAQVGKRKVQTLGVHSVKRKKRRQSAAVERQLKSTELGVEGMESERTQARRVSSNLDILGGKGLHQLRPSCLKREQLVVGSGSSDFTAATSKGLRERSLCEFIGNARVAVRRPLVLWFVRCCARPSHWSKRQANLCDSGTYCRCQFPGIGRRSPNS